MPGEGTESFFRFCTPGSTPMATCVRRLQKNCQRRGSSPPRQRTSERITSKRRNPKQIPKQRSQIIPIRCTERRNLGPFLTPTLKVAKNLPKYYFWVPLDFACRFCLEKPRFRRILSDQPNVLNNFDGKTESTAFRGMVITSGHDSLNGGGSERIKSFLRQFLHHLTPYFTRREAEANESAHIFSVLHENLTEAAL